MAEQQTTPDIRKRARWAVTLLRISLIASLIVLLNLAVTWGIDRLNLQLWPSHVDIAERVLVLGMILYVGLMALPFVPGVEIGLALMMVLGPRGIVLVYACTILALALGYGLGRICPPRWIASLVGWLQLRRAETLLRGLDATAPEKRLEFLAARAPARIGSSLLRRRYLMLAVLLNLPGNFLIGGAGGIALMAGMSGLYPLRGYLLLISVAILPGPLLVLFSDMMA